MQLNGPYRREALNCHGRLKGLIATSWERWIAYTDGVELALDGKEWVELSLDGKEWVELALDGKEWVELSLDGKERVELALDGKERVELALDGKEYIPPLFHTVYKAIQNYSIECIPVMPQPSLKNIHIYWAAIAALLYPAILSISNIYFIHFKINIAIQPILV